MSRVNHLPTKMAKSLLECHWRCFRQSMGHEVIIKMYLVMH